MAITGVVFALLLSGMQEDLQTHIPWVNNVVHKAMPAAVVLDWLIDPPVRRIELHQASLWLAPPIVWLGYTLLRGPLVDWYAYPFVDPRLHGYDRVAASSAVITLGFIAVAWLTMTARASSAAASSRAASVHDGSSKGVGAAALLVSVRGRV